MGKPITVSLDDEQAEKLERFAAGMKESPDQMMVELLEDALDQLKHKGISMTELLERCRENMEEEAGAPRNAAVLH